MSSRWSKLIIILMVVTLLGNISGCHSNAVDIENQKLVSDKAQALVRDFLEFINDPANYTEFVELDRAYEKAIEEKDADFLKNVAENGLGLGETDLLSGAYEFFDKTYYPDLDSFWDKSLTEPQPIYSLFAISMAHLSRYPMNQRDESYHIRSFELKELTLEKEYEVDGLGEPKVYLSQEYLLKGTYHSDRADYEVENPIKVHVTLDENGEHKLKYFVFQNSGLDSVGYVIERIKELD